jgi:hypothetical protein
VLIATATTPTVSARCVASFLLLSMSQPDHVRPTIARAVAPPMTPSTVASFMEWLPLFRHRSKHERRERDVHAGRPR